MNFPNQITGTFNHPITKNVGCLDVYKDGEFYLRFTQEDIVVTGSTFIIDVTNLFPENGNYYILIDNGLFSAITGNFEGISNNADWSFSISEAEFNEDFDNDFLI